MFEETGKRAWAIGKKIRNDLRDLYWTWYGPSLRNPALPPAVNAVLFVCKGNICRSPFAEHLALRVGAERDVRGIGFQSAGLHVSKPKPSPESAIRIAKRFGVELEAHRSQSISVGMVDTFDMIVAMEVWQYRALRTIFRDHREKLFLLPLFEPDRAMRGYEAFNIQDPYGGPPERFAACFQRIERCLTRFLDLVSLGQTAGQRPDGGSESVPKAKVLR